MSWKITFHNKALKFTLLLAILLACWYLGRIFKIDIASYQTLFSSFPIAISGLIFVLLYVCMTTFIWFGPKDVLRIFSAIFFGAIVSTIFVWIGEMVNAVIMFHLSRVLGQEYVQKRFKCKPEKLDQMKADSSLLGVIAWRINPLVPFRLMDLGYGLTQLPFQKYFIAIVAVSFLRILWLQYILAGIGVNLFENFSSLLNYFNENPIIIQYSAIYFLIVIVVTLIAVVARFFRKRKSSTT